MQKSRLQMAGKEQHWHRYFWSELNTFHGSFISCDERLDLVQEKSKRCSCQHISYKFQNHMHTLHQSYNSHRTLTKKICRGEFSLEVGKTVSLTRCTCNATSFNWAIFDGKTTKRTKRFPEPILSFQIRKSLLYNCNPVDWIRSENQNNRTKPLTDRVVTYHSQSPQPDVPKSRRLCRIVSIRCAGFMNRNFKNAP